MEATKQQLLEWLENFVEVPHPSLGNWPPCPYARQVRLNNGIEIQQGTNLIADGIRAVANHLWYKEVVVFYYDPKQWPLDVFAKEHRQLNAFLKIHGLISLDDHPSDVELVNGVSMNFGQAALSIVQECKKLDTAAEILYKKGYYKDWSDDYYQQVFSGRKDPKLTNEVCQNKS